MTIQLNFFQKVISAQFVLLAITFTFGNVLTAEVLTLVDSQKESRHNSGLIYNVSIAPRVEDANGEARYRLWIPQGVKKLRAIIVRQHGCGPGARKFGLEHANDLQWQALARKWNCALLGSQLWAPEEVCSTWYIPADGSERSFLAAIAHFAKVTHHQELNHLPWCIWGHSGGAIWTMNMVYRHPHRVVAAFPRSGGLIPAKAKFPRSVPPQPDSNPLAYQVPVMFCYGELENRPGERFYGAVTSTHHVYNPARKANALWAVAEHPGVSHENGNSRQLAIRFFDAMLKARLQTKNGITTETLRSLQSDRGWLGNLKSKQIQPVKEHPANADQSNADQYAWLPDKTTALAWQELVTRGIITDKSSPSPPLQVTQTVLKDAIKLTWQAEADIESGISEFRVYRGEILIRTIQGHVHKRWNPHGYFHAWNYSDQPIFDDHPLPVMQFFDNSEKRHPNSKYAITTVNQSGLESKKQFVTQQQ